MSDCQESGKSAEIETFVPSSTCDTPVPRRISISTSDVKTATSQAQKEAYTDQPNSLPNHPIGDKNVFLWISFHGFEYVAM